MNYGRAIRTCRAALGLQQRDLADLAGMSPSHLSLIESGGRKPSTSVLERLGSALGVPLHLLLLLAAEPDDLSGLPSEDVDKLSRSLLNLLASRRASVKAP